MNPDQNEPLHVDEAQRLREGIEALLVDLKKAKPHQFSIGLMGVRLRALVPKEDT